MPDRARIMREAIDRDGGLKTVLHVGQVVHVLTLNATRDGYKGVGLTQDSTEASFGFRARGPKVEGVQANLGNFDTPLAAAKAVAVDAAARAAAAAARLTPSPTPLTLAQDEVGGDAAAAAAAAAVVDPQVQIAGLEGQVKERLKGC